MLGGWIDTRRADFDEQQISACAPAADTIPFCRGLVPSYIFRWQSTAAPHAQMLMAGPENEDWYDHYPAADLARVERLVPRMDAETRSIFRKLAATRACRGNAAMLTGCRPQVPGTGVEPLNSASR